MGAHTSRGGVVHRPQADIGRTAARRGNDLSALSVRIGLAACISGSFVLCKVLGLALTAPNGASSLDETR